MTLQGYGGSVQYPKNYVKRATELVQQNGGLYIADEVRHVRTIPVDEIDFFRSVRFKVVSAEQELISGVIKDMDQNLTSVGSHWSNSSISSLLISSGHG